LADRAAAGPHTFDESVMFQDPSVMDLKDDFRNRFRNVSRLMDCVGCDKCRLWGKVQTAGYGAALKILFEFDETKNGENPHLRRTELVALVNTLGRVSHSLEAIQKFRRAVNTGDHSSLDVKGPLVDDGTDQKSDTIREPEFDDDDFDLEDDPYEGDPAPAAKSLSEEFWEELDLVWRAYKMVLRSWVDLPFTLFAILVMEMNRLWNWWIGWPVPDRSWDWHFPTRDEL